MPFTEYCRNIILPAFITLKPYNTMVRFNSKEREELLIVAQSFDCHCTFTLPYVDQIKALERAIRQGQKGKKLAYAVTRLFDVICEDLNYHNSLFPSARISNPLK